MIDRTDPGPVTPPAPLLRLRQVASELADLYLVGRAR
jgi:hypothetical protein